LAFHQQAADEFGGAHLGRAGEEALGECWESVVAMGVALVDGWLWEWLWTGKNRLIHSD